jgi:hypothetical protein
VERREARNLSRSIENTKYRLEACSEWEKHTAYKTSQIQLLPEMAVSNLAGPVVSQNDDGKGPSGER